tara:strand:- start:268 stop:468 length:201 start_codon:yes stop_codon:yes gene_type:complete
MNEFYLRKQLEIEEGELARVWVSATWDNVKKQAKNKAAYNRARHRIGYYEGRIALLKMMINTWKVD